MDTNSLRSSLTPEELTNLLQAWSQGDEMAWARLTPLVMQDLRRLAKQRLWKNRQYHSLQTSELINEAWIHLEEARSLHLETRLQFFALASEVMRNILSERMRARLRKKRGGGMSLLPLESAYGIPVERAQDLIALDDALKDLAAFAPRAARVVELRYFGGLTVEEIAQVMEISPATVKRDWQTAKNWLHKELDQKGSAGDDSATLGNA